MGLKNISAWGLYWTHWETWRGKLTKKKPAGICRSHKFAAFLCCVTVWRKIRPNGTTRWDDIPQYVASTKLHFRLQQPSKALQSPSIQRLSGIVCFPLEGTRCLFQASESSSNWNAHKCVYDACILRGKRDPILVKQVRLPSFFGRFKILCICAHFHCLSHHHRRHHHNDSNGSNDNNQRQWEQRHFRQQC